MSNVDVKGANWGSIATSGGRIQTVTGDDNLIVGGNLTINQVPFSRQWLRPAEADPLKRWEQAVGRLDELARLRARLSAAVEVGHPTAIWGMPGIGKSTLVAMLVHHYGGDYLGGCLWVELGRGFRRPEQCQALLDHWASYAYGGDVQISSQPEHWQKLKFDSMAVNTLLSGRGPLLVVLDDVWDLEATEPLRQALPAETRLLLTTRDSRIAEDAGQAGAFPLDLLSSQEAMALLQARLPDLPAASLEKLAAGLGHHAHALTIAAGDIRRRSTLPRREQAVNEILQRLEAGQGFGDLPQLDQRNRQSAVEIALRASYDDMGDAMGPDYQRRFRFLGSLGPAEASFSTEAAAALWEDDAAAAAEFLDVLRDRALIRQAADDRWAQHLLVHAYNLALLRRANELDGARDLYLGFILNYTDTAFERPPAEWGALVADLPHVRYAGQWFHQHATALLGDLELLAQPEASATNTLRTETDAAMLKLTLVFAINVLGYVIEGASEGKMGRGWLWMGLAAARWLKTTPGEAAFLFALGLWHQQHGWHKAAYQYGSASLALSRQLERFPHASALLLSLGQVSLVLGQPERAREHATEALDISRQRQEAVNESLALNLLGMVQLALGQADEGLQTLQQALGMARAAHSPMQEAIIQQNVAYAYLESGQLHQALDLFEQGLPTLPGEAGSVNRAILLQNTGMTYFSLRQPQQALKLLEQALALAREAGDRNLEAIILNNLGVTHEALGQPEQALRLLEAAAPMLRETGNRNMEALALLNLGFRHFGAGRLDDALAQAEQARVIFEDIANPGNAGLARFLLSSIYQRQGQAEQSAAVFQPVLQQPNLLRATAGKLAVVALGLADANARLQLTILAASLYRTANQPIRAIDLLEQALPLLDELDDTAQFISIYWQLTSLYAAVGQDAKTARLNRRLFSNTRYAQALLAHIQADITQVADPAALAAARGLLGSLFLATNQPAAAMPLLELALDAPPSADPTASVILLNYLGIGYQALAQPQRARQYFERALPLAQAARAVSLETMLLNNLGLTYRAESQYKPALDIFQRALAQARQTGDHVNESVVLGNIGFVQYNLHQLPAAIETMNQALALTREFENRDQEIRILTNLQQAYHASDQLQAAQTHGELAITLARELGHKPLEATALSNLGSFLATQAGQRAAAIRYIEQAVQLLETYQLPQDAAGQTPEQLRITLASIAAGPDDGSGDNALMRPLLILLDAPDTGAVRQVIEANSLMLLSVATDEALGVLIVSAEQGANPERAEITRRYLRLLQACRQVGVAEALRAFEAQPPDSLWHWWRGTRLFQLDSFAAAEDQFSLALVLAPESASAYQWRARARGHLGQPALALADFGRSLALNADNGDAYYWRGHLHMDLAALPAARADFERAVQLQPDDAMNWLWLGRAQHAQADLPDALHSLDRAVELQPDQGLARYWRGRVRLDLGQTAAALADLDDAAPLERRNTGRAVAIGLWRGIAQQLLGQLEPAQQAWAQARALLPAEPTLPADLGQLALLEAAQGQIGPAREHLSAALESPDRISSDQANQLRQLARLFPQPAGISELSGWLTERLA